ncbi:MAG: hypothetical protein LBC86_10480 [Oscillospiraceae bacterium]|jgi:hypothetical protein|nr:hypothetical protein [Oscillospiraceae bacterium]
MLNKMFILFIISCLLSSCGVNENPAGDSYFIEDYNDELIKTINSNVYKPESESEPDIVNDVFIVPPYKFQQDEIERKILEPFIVLAFGHDLFTSNYCMNVLSLCGAVKQIEYEPEDGEFEFLGIYDERNNINIHRFANAIYEQMNDDSIPVAALFDKIPDEIVELARAVETLDLDKSYVYNPENSAFYIIIGTDEDRRAVFIGGRWGDFGDTLGSNELTRMINEYLENTERREP